MYPPANIVTRASAANRQSPPGKKTKKFHHKYETGKPSHACVCRSIASWNDNVPLDSCHE